MDEVCTDGRFDLIARLKRELVEATNIETSPEEMAVLDSILFRLWQMGWLDRLEQPAASPWHRVEDGLPRGHELVVVAVKDTAGDTPFWYTQCGWITTNGEYWIVDNEICDYVVAWMPLPEPPKEDA